LYDPVEAELKQKEEEKKAKESSDYYHGLNVGGKKVNWALELQPNAKKPKIPRVSALHYAAYFDQPASVEFLLGYVNVYQIVIMCLLANLIIGTSLLSL